jgi:branched-chain amino acid transport system substrate-binding protein
VEAAPFNFFYGPSYSDALRAMLQWRRRTGAPAASRGGRSMSTWARTIPNPNSPKEAGETLARELGFEVLPAIQFALTPGDYTAQCLGLRQQGANYAYLGNTAGLQHLRPAGLQTAGVQVQFLGNVWGMDENAMKAAGTAPRTAWSSRSAPRGLGAGCAGMQPCARDLPHLRPVGNAYGPCTTRRICAAMLMVEAMETAADDGGQITGERIRTASTPGQNWVPRGFDGVCNPRPSPTRTIAARCGCSSTARRGGNTAQGSVDELMRAGTTALEPVATVELERKREWLGW